MIPVIPIGTRGNFAAPWGVFLFCFFSPSSCLFRSHPAGMQRLLLPVSESLLPPIQRNNTTRHMTRLSAWILL